MNDRRNPRQNGFYPGKTFLFVNNNIIIFCDIVRFSTGSDGNERISVAVQSDRVESTRVTERFRGRARWSRRGFVCGNARTEPKGRKLRSRPVVVVGVRRPCYLPLAYFDLIERNFWRRYFKFFFFLPKIIRAVSKRLNAFYFEV